MTKLRGGSYLHHVDNVEDRNPIDSLSAIVQPLTVSCHFFARNNYG